MCSSPGGASSPPSALRWLQLTSVPEMPNRHDVQPAGTGPTRLSAMLPDKPLLLPPVKL